MLRLRAEGGALRRQRSAPALVAQRRLSRIAAVQSEALGESVHRGVASLSVVSLRETPMTRRLWEEIGGTLFEEYSA